MKIRHVALAVVLVGLTVSAACCSTPQSVAVVPVAEVTSLPTALTTPTPAPIPTLTPAPTEPEPTPEIEVVVVTAATVPVVEIVRQQALAAGAGGPDPDAEAWVTYTVSVDTLDQSSLIQQVEALFPQLAGSDHLTITVLTGEGLQVTELSTTTALFNGYPTQLGSMTEGEAARQFRIGGQAFGGEVAWSAEYTAPIAKANDGGVWVLNPYTGKPAGLPADARQLRGYAIDQTGKATLAVGGAKQSKYNEWERDNPRKTLSVESEASTDAPPRPKTPPVQKARDCSKEIPKTEDDLKKINGYESVEGSIVVPSSGPFLQTSIMSDTCDYKIPVKAGTAFNLLGQTPAFWVVNAYDQMLFVPKAYSSRSDRDTSTAKQ